MNRLPSADRDPADPRRAQDRDDIDPTGMRALLSALPDPGPMPADLVERITASLAAEQAGGSGDARTDAPDSAAAASRGATVHPLAPARGQRSRGTRRLPGFAIAASTAVIAGGAVLGLLGMDRGLSMMSEASDTLAGFSSGTDEAGGDAGAASSQAESMLPEENAEAQGVVILTSGATLSSTTLVDHAQAMLAASFAPGDAGVAGDEAGSDAPLADGSDAPLGEGERDAERAMASSALGTAEGAADCLGGLLSIPPQEAATLVTAVDFVRFDGQSVALVVARPGADGDGQNAAPSPVSTAYLVPLDCRRANAVALHEPVRLAS